MIPDYADTLHTVHWRDLVRPRWKKHMNTACAKVNRMLGFRKRKKKKKKATSNIKKQ